MDRYGNEGTAVEEMTDSEAVAEKERGGGVLGTVVVIVLAEAESTEMRFGYDSASNVEEEG